MESRIKPIAARFGLEHPQPESNMPGWTVSDCHART